MATVMDIYRFLDEKAPFSTQMSFDNAGFLVGRGGKEVHTILVALDITEAVVDEAVQILRMVQAFQSVEGAGGLGALLGGLTGRH